MKIRTQKSSTSQDKNSKLLSALPISTPRIKLYRDQEGMMWHFAFVNPVSKADVGSSF